MQVVYKGLSAELLITLISIFGMMTNFKALICTLLLCVIVQAAPDVSDGTKKAGDVQTEMYEFLRNMALPNSKKDEPIKQRFVLQVST